VLDEIIHPFRANDDQIHCLAVLGLAFERPGGPVLDYQLVPRRALELWRKLEFASSSTGSATDASSA
jgi:hypothetical protein